MPPNALLVSLISKSWNVKNSEKDNGSIFISTHLPEDVYKRQNLHSFFIDDLEKAKKIETVNLNAYLYGNKKERMNLDSKKDSVNFHPHLFEQILQPKNYPLGRFPSNTTYALSLMQQVAVNLSIGFDNNPVSYTHLYGKLPGEQRWRARCGGGAGSAEAEEKAPGAGTEKDAGGTGKTEGRT